MRTIHVNKDSIKDILEDLLKRSPNNYGTYEASVEEIVNRVKEGGDAVLFEYAKKFDRAELTTETVAVT